MEILHHTTITRKAKKQDYKKYTKQKNNKIESFPNPSLLHPLTVCLSVCPSLSLLISQSFSIFLSLCQTLSFFPLSVSLSALLSLYLFFSLSSLLSLSNNVYVVTWESRLSLSIVMLKISSRIIWNLAPSSSLVIANSLSRISFSISSFFALSIARAWRDKKLTRKKYITKIRQVKNEKRLSI